MEIYRLAFYRDGKQLDECLALGIEAILKMWGDASAPEYGSGNKKTLENCILALEDFFINYHPAEDPIKPLMIDGKPAVEFTFAIPIPGVFHPETGDVLPTEQRIRLDEEYLIRAWIGVLNYLLADYRFVYE
jgi:hypothetical protein